MVLVTSNEVDGVPPSKNTDQPWIFAYNDKFQNIDVDNSKGGKWMIFVKNSFVDEQWYKIKEAISSGTLWQAKVSRMDRKKKNHGIMVYTVDCEDVDDVISVLDHLEQIGAVFPTSTIFYKTNEATTAGIYGGRGQKPWLYSSENVRSLGTKKKTPPEPRTLLPSAFPRDQPLQARVAPKPRVSLLNFHPSDNSSEGPGFSFGDVALTDEDFGVNPNNFGVRQAGPKVRSPAFATYLKAHSKVTDPIDATVSFKLKVTVAGDGNRGRKTFEDSASGSASASFRAEPNMDTRLTVLNPIGALQELCVVEKWALPEYEDIRSDGPDHCRSFSVSCVLMGHQEIGIGTKKKTAKTEAARKMYEHVKRSPPGRVTAKATERVEEDIAAAISKLKRLLSDMPTEDLRDLSKAVDNEYALRLARVNDSVTSI